MELFKPEDSSLVASVARTLPDHTSGVSAFLASLHGLRLHHCEGWYRKGEEISLVIENLLHTRSAVADDIQQILEQRHVDFEAATMGIETDFSSESHYEERWKVDTDRLDTPWAK